MSEASFWKYLVKCLPKEGHYSRIESHDTSSGFPDIHYTLSGNSGTIELKDAKRPGSKYPFSGPSALRKSQLRWIEAEIAANGVILLALQCGDRVYMLRAGDYYDGLHTMTLEEITRVSVLNWRKGQIRRGIYEDAYPLETALGDLMEGQL